MLHLVLYVVKRQLTICFKSSKPIQIGLHNTDVFENPPLQLASRRPIWSDVTSVDTITQLESGAWRVESGEWRVESGAWRVENGQRTGRRLLLLPTLLCDSQVSISFVIYALW